MRSAAAPEMTVMLAHQARQIGVLFDYFERAVPALLATVKEIQAARS